MTTTAARPPPAAATRTTAARPTSTQGKHTFAVAADDIPDAAHASICVADLPAVTIATKYQSTICVAAFSPVAATAKATAAFSIHNNEDNDWDLAPLGPSTLGNVATGATGQVAHHVDHCGLQVFDLLASSDSESEDEFDA
jgi:hypothetical protein